MEHKLLYADEIECELLKIGIYPAVVKGVLQRMCESIVETDSEIKALEEKCKKQDKMLERFREDRARAEEMAEEMNRYLSNEIHPNIGYSYYTELFEYLYSITDWKYDEYRKEESK